MNPLPNKEHDPQLDANRMLNQVSEAFALPWPRKPHGKPTSSPGGKATRAPRAGRSSRHSSKRPRRNSAA